MLDEPTRLVEPEDVMPAQSPSGPRSNPRVRPDPSRHLSGRRRQLENVT